MFDAIAMGMSCFDFGIAMEKMPGFNENGKVLSVSWQGGGKTSNGVIATARLGGTCAFYGARGGQFGEFIANDFARHGVDISHFIDKEGENSVLDVCIADRSNGGRSFCPVAPFTTSPKLSMEDLDPEFLKNTRWLFVSDASPVTLEAIRIVRANGGKVLVDADRYDPDIMANLKMYDVIIPSEFFYRTHFEGREEQYEENLKEFKTLMNPDSILIFTLGENGLVGLDENNEFFKLPSFHVDVIDTTGAGDVFHGAYLAALLHGMDIKTAARFSSAVSAIKCTRVGGRAAIPDYKTVMHFLETGEIDYSEIDERVAMYAKMPL